MGEKKEKAAKDKTADDYMDWSKFPEIVNDPSKPKEEKALVWLKSLNMPQDLEKLSLAFLNLYVSYTFRRLSETYRHPKDSGDRIWVMELAKYHSQLSVEFGGYPSMSEMEKYAVNLIR